MFVVDGKTHDGSWLLTWNGEFPASSREFPASSQLVAGTLQQPAPAPARGLLAGSCLLAYVLH
jgi:hypothetical protein